MSPLFLITFLSAQIRYYFTRCSVEPYLRLRFQIQMFQVKRVYFRHLLHCASCREVKTAEAARHTGSVRTLDSILEKTG